MIIKKGSDSLLRNSKINAAVMAQTELTRCSMAADILDQVGIGESHTILQLLNYTDEQKIQEVVKSLNVRHNILREALNVYRDSVEKLYTLLVESAIGSKNENNMPKRPARAVGGGRIRPRFAAGGQIVQALNEQLWGERPRVNAPVVNVQAPRLDAGGFAQDFRAFVAANPLGRPNDGWVAEGVANAEPMAGNDEL